MALGPGENLRDRSFSARRRCRPGDGCGVGALGERGPVIILLGLRTF